MSSRISRSSFPMELCLAVAARVALRRRSSARAGSWFQHHSEPAIAGSVQAPHCASFPGRRSSTVYPPPWRYRGTRPTRLASLFIMLSPFRTLVPTGASRVYCPAWGNGQHRGP
jgi:hypothetical protein